MLRYVSRERRVTATETMMDLFTHMGWFDREPVQGRYVARTLEQNSVGGITADDIHLAALYVEQYTDPETIDGLSTAEIMTMMDRECTTLFTLEYYKHGPRGL